MSRRCALGVDPCASRITRIERGFGYVFVFSVETCDDSILPDRCWTEELARIACWPRSRAMARCALPTPVVPVSCCRVSGVRAPDHLSRFTVAPIAAVAHVVAMGSPHSLPAVLLPHGNSQGKNLAAVSPICRLSARSHRLKNFVAQIEVVEESRGGMHGGNPEDDVAEGGVD
jgi:hypothetical protein